MAYGPTQKWLICLIYVLKPLTALIKFNNKNNFIWIVLSNNLLLQKKYFQITNQPWISKQTYSTLMTVYVLQLLHQFTILFHSVSQMKSNRLRKLEHNPKKFFCRWPRRCMFEVHFFFPHRASNIMLNLTSFCSASFNSFLVMTFMQKSWQACTSTVSIP